ncbi:MAG: hypothetical protein J6U54_05325 [Clostridiales bacterium]|nr:hypothetical protein [Clostridiales bacterium]
MFDFDIKKMMDDNKNFEREMEKTAYLAKKHNAFRFSFQGEDNMDKRILEDLEVICNLIGIDNTGVLSTTGKEDKTFYCIQFHQSDPETIKLIQTLHSKIVTQSIKKYKAFGGESNEI